MKISLAFALAAALALRVESGLGPPPLGLDSFVPVPEDNLLSKEKVNLGRRLFFDKRLSNDGTLSCASCHDPKLSFSDGRTVARGIGGAEGTRNSPALINRGYGRTLFWDGRAQSLEELALEPIANPKELGSTIAGMERRTGLCATDVAAALASYMRTIRSGDSRFDRYAAGDRRALSTLELEGLNVFRRKGGCAACHIGSNFTDELFHNTGVAWREGKLADEGRHAVSGIERDRGAFKTPSLRDLPRTAPYMHDGSLVTLEDVVEFYSKGGRQNPYLDSRMQPRYLSASEKVALTAFLRALSGRVQD